MPLSPEQTAWLTAALITLMVACWLMSKLPRCDHAVCAESCKAERAKERRATTQAEVERLHAGHDRFRPQPACPLCAKPDDET